MVVIENLSFSYGPKRIFENFSCVMDTPATCIESPSGGGKTTLLRLIAGLLKPDGGRIMAGGSKICYLFQEDRLLPWLTARENVAAVLPKARRAEADVFLDRVELSAEGSQLPKNLSGGQARRVALARALAYGGELLLLDEPFKGLDPELTERLIPTILAQKVPIIMASHARREAELLGCEILRLPDISF
jgi:ABC-type nitrate/sulfonate/bicarbonate transport system ATPase subunit